MRIATETDRDLVINILTESFKNNTSVKYVVKSDSIKHIKRLMHYSFDVCNDFGEIFIDSSNNGCVLILYSNNEKTTLKSTFRDIKAAFNLFGLKNVLKVLNRQKKIKTNYPFKEWIYLWYIGVNPLEQKKGIGTELLNEVLKISKQKSLPILLETSVESNLDWYKKNGFSIYKELFLDYKLYSLKSEYVSI